MASKSTAASVPAKVHVHLYYGVDPSRYRKDDNVGCLYGYHHAESNSLALSYSQDHPEGRAMRLIRRGLKALLGCDLIHTFRNRTALLEADVIWTHTEREYLSAALLLMLKRGPKPLLLAQSVWLLDIWNSLGVVKRAIYKVLLNRADLLTTLTHDNAALVRRFWNRDATVVLYGIGTEDFPLQPVTQWRPHAPLRVAALGNDRDRDWQTFMEAFENDKRFSARLATQRKVPRPSEADNVVVAPVTGIDEQRKLYEWADVIVVPLHPNHHASGITVVLEGVMAGKLVIATDIGGLKDYFSHDAVSYVPVHDPHSLRETVAALAADPDGTTARIVRAQQELVSKELTTRGYARQHVALTHQMLRDAAFREGVTSLARPGTTTPIKRNPHKRWTVS
ncbi:glycosyl transferase [Caballeronia sordidicola]|uniref:Glycosyl transferase n=1 Tax=Caballeronia sordidicola TaxID=196367 RepID=A0A158I8E8_CABSO|nr:glycosyltransferase [Caballeronia sordidicola]SAL52856.1 glycosyl transferase [Caballeronia sordidicola]